MHWFNPTWKSVEAPHLGVMNLLDRSIRDMEARNPGLLPNLRQGSVILTVSDFSGQHRSAKFDVLSFLMADLEQCGLWEALRSQVRRDYLGDGRRMAFKNLGDRRRKLALGPFLEAAEAVVGASVSFAVHKAVQSLFRQQYQLDMNHAELAAYKHWRAGTFERLLRVVHMISFFLAGLSREGQDVFWFTDEDDIAANRDRLTELTKVFAFVSSWYLRHDLRHLRCGTTRSDVNRQLEDFAAVPDLVAGALSELLTAMETGGTLPRFPLFLPAPSGVSDKTKTIMCWFAQQSGNLKRLVCLINPSDTSPSLEIRWLRFQEPQ